MAKITKEEAARREGIAYAYRIAKEDGLEALEEDMRMRGITGCPVGLDRQYMDEFAANVKNNILDTVIIMTACTLQDEFDFGKKRIERFLARFNEKASVINDGYATWADFQEQLKRELRITLNIRENNKDVRVRRAK